MLLVEGSQGEVAPYGGELRVEAVAQLPVLDGHIILPLVVHQTAEVVRRLGTSGVHGDGTSQDEDVLQAVGEAAVAVGALSLAEGLHGLVGFALLGESPPYIIMCHRAYGLLVDGSTQDVDGLLPQSGLGIVEGELVIVQGVAVHHLVHELQVGLASFEEIFLVERPIVELVNGEGVLGKCQSFLLTADQAQQGYAQGTALMMMPSGVHGASGLIEGIVKAPLQSRNLCAGIVGSILPATVPGSLIEPVVGLIHLALKLQCEREVIERLSEVWVRVTLLQHLHGTAQIRFCLLRPAVA